MKLNKNPQMQKFNNKLMITEGENEIHNKINQTSMQPKHRSEG